ncbi:MAG TPA: hypothetical protein VF472_07655 [Burkholderiaceae bacterium]
MKTLIAASVTASVFTLASFAAGAQPTGGNNTVTITDSPRSIVLPESPRAMSEQEFGAYAGSYELANGDSIVLFTRAGVKLAALHGGKAHALVAKNGNTFVARDRQLQVTIDKRDDGKVGGEVLMAAPEEKVAGGEQQRVVSVAFH